MNAIRIKERKYDYPDFNQAFQNLQRVYNILSISEEPTQESAEKLKAALETFSSFVKDATPDDKKSKEILT
ncbi:MAG: hypothetical protein U5L96_00475 [Owenweeksia sp.]|nr:hypothetical protein [Owenweeksia sp.]